ncbi:MAG TPA: carbohydrate porin [Pirellulaceae bacterium]|nr:carbohydrate porin [Pirellulaceae bacterium]
MMRWNAKVVPLLFALMCVPVLARSQDLLDPFPRNNSTGTWPTFSTPAAREDWFDYKAEVDAEKGLLSRLAPNCRRRLADDGINVFGWYMMAFQGNAVGGIDQDFEATGLNDFGLDFDFEKLCCYDGLSARISGSWAWGPNLTDDVGATIPVNAVYSGTACRFFEMYFEQWMLDDTVSLRAGRLTTGWEYGLDYDFFTQYLSGAYRLNVGSLGINSPNFSLIPYSNWGARLKWQPDDNWQFKASFMNGHPRDFADPKYSGLQLDFQPGKGSFWIGEAVYRWQATDAQREESGRLPGQFKFGGYADTGQYDFVDGSGDKESGLGSLYFLLRQKVWEPEPLSDKGIHLWTAFSYAWDRNIVTFPYYWNGGLVWQGPFGTRSDDTLALGFARGWYSDSLAGQSTETVLECSYNWYVNDVLTLTPDLQYVMRPGGTGTIDDALLLGLLTYITY